MFPKSFSRPHVVRLEQAHRVNSIRMADVFLARASRWMNRPAATLDDYAVNMHRAAKQLLGAYGAFREAGMGAAADRIRQCREDTLRLRDNAARQGGRR